MISCASLSWEMVLTTDTVSSKFTVSIYVRLQTFWTPLVECCIYQYWRAFANLWTILLVCGDLTSMSQCPWVTVHSVQCTIWQIFVSSANFKILLTICSSMSFIYTTNKSGPRTDPWGTPLITHFQSEYCQFNTTLCCLPYNRFSIHRKTFPLNPCACNFEISLLSRTFDIYTCRCETYRHAANYDHWSVSVFPASPIGDCILQFHNPSPDSNPNPSFKSGCNTNRWSVIVITMHAGTKR